MKIGPQKKRFLLRITLPVLTAVLTATVPNLRADVAFTNLHSFGVISNGALPYAGLVQGKDGSFYGTTDYGGTNGGWGTVFKISSTGALTSLYSFSNGVDGAQPAAGLVQGSDGYFYGTASSEFVTNNWGAVFKISSTGAFTTLYSFTNGADGANPGTALVQGNDGCFYGTVNFGSTTNTWGHVFRISTNGAFTLLYSFTNINDGAAPEASLIQGSDGYFYGTTQGGGTNGSGTVFKISSTGEFTKLYSFIGDADGSYPEGALVQGSDGYFYGTTSYGGTNDWGTVFKISSNGAFTLLYSFTNGVDGGWPYAGLVEGKDGYFYGTASWGGTADDGTVFKISSDGAFTSLYSFTNGIDGGYPWGALVQASDGCFYGTTSYGFPNSLGTVFKINSAGAFTLLYSFAFASDGAGPLAGLVQASDGDFYGTTSAGGSNAPGTVFKITSSGDLTLLYSFTNGADGSRPESSLVQGRDGSFYGTAEKGGGTNDGGTIFKIGSSGALTPLHSFTFGRDGANPYAGLIQGSDGDFYGTTYSGGTDFDGTVFKITADGALTPLHSFIGADGANPEAGLVPGSDGYFYGTTDSGGRNYNGTVFKISPSGILTSLYSFTGGNDGGTPQASLVEGVDGSFYGTASSGGKNGNGTIFKISPTGKFGNLYSFTNGIDGANPEAALVQGNDGNFYGTTYYGGTNGYGAVFKISSAGSFTPLYSFTGGNDGASPAGALIQASDGSFYGTTSGGGKGRVGVAFRLSVGLPEVSPSVSIPIDAAFGFTNGIFGFDVSRSPASGSGVVIQFSPDLQTWTPLQTNLIDSPLLHFSDPQSPANREGFYRAVLQ
jgi:uncharacterized repeat protein (TIGR03803 family)